MATTEVTPTGTPAVGRFKAGIFVGTLATPGVVDLSSDIGHAGFLNVSFYIPGEDWAPSGSQNKGEDQRRGATETYESFGKKTWTIPDLIYIENMQGTGPVKTLLTEGALCTLICRWGLPGSTDWAEDDEVYAWYVELGMRWPVPSASGEFGKLAYQQPVVVKSAAVEGVAIVA